jgi:hypothetical protein
VLCREGRWVWDAAAAAAAAAEAVLEGSVDVVAGMEASAGGAQKSLPMSSWASARASSLALAIRVGSSDRLSSADW